MPELPEAERARQILEQHAVGRTVARVDDTDAFVCRPHPAGEIDGVMHGLVITGARRRGKALWLETDGGIDLALHLGMSGSFRANGAPSPRNWDRFTIWFTDGTHLALHDKRRLGRARLDADRTRLGPDAADVTRADFRRRVGRGRIAVKARLLDQSTLAGVGNLIADEALWRARIGPSVPAASLDEARLDRLRVELRAVIRDALKPGGGSGRGAFARSRRSGTCVRCGAPLERGTIGGRTTYWCTAEQAG
ncbi:MAG: Formamidopyrimidine-DNA glycosylase [uncultured Thermoleophilia bacterium]|uniref:Formamidopyrimidine-DNA glycosylase n=1 Tax=uncultured Thermoleophilia bacterium TaxID=1497501 RepID=A0A6J4TFN0_9ACTN|nr:MAG: Formamidopyrimidine-DNA glycosylase [uncultured Thermoleophilia bacterium]